jgi:hypothetical protein
MGYSGRYHAASLAAVFIALAIGILIGIGLAGDVVSTASEELENSLRSDLDEAESRVDALEGDLNRAQEYSDRTYPALVADRLPGSSVAVIGLGGLPPETVEAIEEAVDPAGARVSALGVVDVPPDTDALADAAPSRFGGVRRGGAGLEELARAAGAGLIGGSELVDQLRGALFSRFSGSLAEVDRVVFVATIPEDLEAEQEAAADRLVGGLIDGARRSSAGVAGAERTDDDPTTLGAFGGAGIPTVDHVDLPAGRASLVFALLGAGGDYGTKEEADSYLPELIEPGPGGSAPNGQ